MTSGGAITVHRALKEPGGSISNDQNYYKHLRVALQLIFSCHNSHLNGVYYTDPKGAPEDTEGITWYHWLGWGNSLKSSTMMIKRKKF